MESFRSHASQLGCVDRVVKRDYMAKHFQTVQSIQTDGGDKLTFGHKGGDVKTSEI